MTDYSGYKESVQNGLSSGIYVPTLVFFDENGNLDLDVLQSHVLWLAHNGAVGIVTHGSNGEAVHLSRDQRNKINRAVRLALNDARHTDVQLVVGCSAQSVEETVEMCKEAAEAHATSALVLPPSYYANIAPSWENMVLTFYKNVAEQSPIPIVIYNYPVATGGRSLDSDVVKKLMVIPNIIGCKFTCGDTGKMGRVASAARSLNPKFRVLAGSADVITPAYSVGATGAIVGYANVAPLAAVTLHNMLQKGPSDLARGLQSLIANGDWELIKTGFVGGKKILSIIRSYGTHGSPPIFQFTTKEAQELTDRFNIDELDDFLCCLPKHLTTA